MQTIPRILIADDDNSVIDDVENHFNRYLELNQSTIKVKFEKATTITDAINKLNNNGFECAIIDYEFADEPSKSGLDIIKNVTKENIIYFGLTNHEDKLLKLDDYTISSFDKRNMMKLILLLFTILAKQYEINSLKQKLTIAKQEIEMPHIELRKKSIILSIVFMLLWLCWKLTGYIILNPYWAVIGFLSSIIFYTSSYFLKLDSERFFKKFGKENKK